ncbi:hypothetical protein [Pontibacter chinhatensis]|uniref:Uncharacterized protein n=1 Tax=Pontibacter chinhatensis TaxID=1436961 RepID=A0A1I2ZSJ7_9BACT|nr:hypothetical protein [Pontibacter chinhatensis]SFH40788.1 hypothetical protein SAMN05421739_11823 [Pontibacter chinhatensis]
MFFALLDDQFRTEIAEPMEDIKQILAQAEDYIMNKLATMSNTRSVQL